MAQHTLNDEEYHELIRAREEAYAEANRLRGELVAAKQADPANRIKALNDFARSAIEIVRFAVANLNPESIRGWPTNALKNVADLMAALPDYNVADDSVLAGELHAFARDCDEYALIRQNKREAKLNADAAAPKGDLAESAP